MAKKPPLGSGRRFDNLTRQLASEPGVRNPSAVAAAIGDKKYGRARMQQMARKGR